MSFLDLFKMPDINEGVKTAQSTKQGLLIDVRTEQEYADGHIPGSINIPAHKLQNIEKRAPQKDTPLFLYCQSGSRSARATKLLKDAGYQNISNIGGFAYWQGKTKKGAK